jgi:hypothetical protein
VFIIKALTTNNDITLIPVWKDNSNLSLTIEHSDVKIVLLDSLQLIPGTLSNILNSFNCKIKKGLFPYKAVNENSLYYIGPKPAKILYQNISDLEYVSIPADNWNLRQETLNYLKSDVEGLLDVVSKFNKNIYRKYKLDATQFKTLPGLALAAYTSNYVPKELIPEIRTIKGELDKEIRTAYFGGNVGTYINKISNGYYYDMNSQYPKAMLEDMPVGSPVLSLEKDLSKIFGFVYGEITAPNEEILQIPFIQHRDSA